VTEQLLSDGTRIFYDDTLNGREVLFFSHGLLFDTELFAPQARAFAGDYRVIRYDHRGQGRSDESDLRSIDMGTLTADAIELIEKLGVAPVHFIGLSMGGFVGMRIAARRPELVRSLTLLDTSADAEPAENIGQYRAMNAFVRLFGARWLTKKVMRILFGKTFLTDVARSSERERWSEHLVELRPSIWRAVNGVIERESVLGELSRISAPTLVLVGEEDVATVPEKSRRIQARIAGSKMQVIPRAGHSATIEEPEAVNAAIREFLRGVTAL
jgi:pimeloyl-ACP methyl ester carboxylesterase